MGSCCKIKWEVAEPKETLTKAVRSVRLGI